MTNNLVLQFIISLGHKADTAYSLYLAVHRRDHGHGHPLRLLLRHQAVASCPGSGGGGCSSTRRIWSGYKHYCSVIGDYKIKNEDGGESSSKMLFIVHYFIL